MLKTAEAYGIQFLVPPGDSGVGASILDYGEFAKVETDFILDIVGNGIFVDVGANIGAIALPVSRRASMVLAIEANRGFANLLAANALNNRMYNVSVLHAAIGDKECISRFPVMPLFESGNLGTSGFGLPEAYAREPVMMLTLDRITPPRTSVIKVDVEGYELNVIKGSSEILRKLRPYWIIESSTDTPNNASVLATMNSLGYSTYWFYTPFVTPTPLRGSQPEKLRGDISIFAAPSEKRQPDWEMNAAIPGERRPRTIGDFPYLSRYGYTI
jgi:FkbM family methyltransferase